MFEKKSGHLFSEHDQCTIVPVREVPITLENPIGLAWERPCKCPSWTTVKQEVIIAAKDGGIPVTQVNTISGCVKKLFPWLISGAVSQASAALHETVKTRKVVESEDPLRGLARVFLDGVVNPLALLEGTNRGNQSLPTDLSRDVTDGS